jgi:hypothetical protein
MWSLHPTPLAGPFSGDRRADRSGGSAAGPAMGRATAQTNLMPFSGVDAKLSKDRPGGETTGFGGSVLEAVVFGDGVLADEQSVIEGIHAGLDPINLRWRGVSVSVRHKL